MISLPPCIVGLMHTITRGADPFAKPWNLVEKSLVNLTTSVNMGWKKNPLKLVV